MILLVQVLAIILLGVHQANVLLELLDERLCKWLRCFCNHLFNGILSRQKLNEHVLPEDASLPCSILKDHYSQAILNAVFPLAAINATIGPVHLAVALLLVVLVLALVIAATCPPEFTLSMLHILDVLTLVCVCHFITARLFPDTFALFHAFDKNPRVSVSIGPAILAVSISFAVVVLAEVNVAVGERVGALAVPQAELPLAFVAVAVGPLVLAVPMRLILVPLADIAVPGHTLPDAVAVLDAILPFAVIGVPVHPSVEALARHFAQVVLAQILIPIAEPLVALPVPLVLHPVALVHAPDLVDTDPGPVPMPVDNFTAVERLLVTLDREISPRLQLLKVKQIGYHFIDHVLFLFLDGQVLVCMTSFLFCSVFLVRFVMMAG